MSEENDEISNLCVSCGMCCDGTLFPRAALRDEDDRKLADSLGFVTFDYEGQPSLKLPCHYFSSCCTRYDKARPSVCSAFFCRPIKKYTHGKQTFEETEQQVKCLQGHRDQLMKVASQFPEFAGLNIRELKNKLEELSENAEKVTMYRHLFLLLFIFEDVRTKYFKTVKKDESLAD